MAMTKRKRIINNHLDGMHKHLVALRDYLYLGDGVRKVEARKIYEALIETMEALDNALDPRQGRF